ncbi:MAG: MoaD/ThiS family protein [Candidatus Thorarchaeota archaeon]
MNKGIKYKDHDRFPFRAREGATIEDLIDDLHDEYRERFDVYLEDKQSRALKRDAIVIVNGMNMVARDGVKTRLSDGDLVVFMIAAVGG